jgi:hypothetical protein
VCKCACKCKGSKCKCSLRDQAGIAVSVALVTVCTPVLHAATACTPGPGRRWLGCDRMELQLLSSHSSRPSQLLSSHSPLRLPPAPLPPLLISSHLISSHLIASHRISSHLSPPQAALLEAMDDAELRALAARAGFVSDVNAAATRAELLVRAADARAVLLPQPSGCGASAGRRPCPPPPPHPPPPPRSPALAPSPLSSTRQP